MYKLKVNDTFNYEIDVADLEAFDAYKINSKQFHIISNDKSIEAEIISKDIDAKIYTIKINNSEYKININDILDQQIEALGFELGASKKVNAIKAPMPGLILEINVNEGDEVTENQSLLILEAMKMENVITSPREGIIKSIKVEKGNAVEKNTLLIEFE